MRNLAFDSIWTMVAQILTILAGFLVSVLVARSLGPDLLGGYASIILIVSTAKFLVNPGIYSSANYYLSTHQLSHRDVFVLAFALSIPVALVGGAASIFSFPSFFDETAVSIENGLRLTIVAATIISVIGMSMDGVAVGSGRIRIVARWQAITAILTSIAVLVLWLTKNLTFNTAITMYCVQQASVAFGTIIIALPGRTYQSSEIDRTVLNSFLKYGFSVYSGRVLWFLSQRVDMYLVLLLAGQSALGVYSVAANLAGQIKLIPVSVGVTIMPNIGSLSRDASAKVVTQVSQTLLALMGSIGMLFGLVGWLFIPVVYGSEFDAAVVPFLIMLPGIIAIGAYSVVEPYFRAQGKPLIPVGLSLTGALANAMLSLLLIPQYGIIGASLGYTLSYFLQLATTCLVFAKQSKMPGFSLVDIRKGYAGTLHLVRGMLQYVNLPKSIRL